jgi:hypothetical protein
MPVGGIKLTDAKGLRKGRNMMSFVTQTTTSCANGKMVDISMTDDVVDDSKYANGMVSGHLDDIALRARERLAMFR